MKRLFDLAASLCGLLVFGPLIAVVMFLVWRQDGHSPIYKGSRVGLHGRPFQMAKLRSMVINADKSGVESTAASDNRITPLGHFIRRWKLDELTQLWNVLKGDMSLVGPRPNTAAGVAAYTDAERKILEARPGITDFASLVFSDEGDILNGSPDPDADYDRLIRPWKSRLAILYVEKNSVLLDLKIIGLTVLAIFNKPAALIRLQPILRDAGCEPMVMGVARRDKPLPAAAPPTL